MLPVPVYNAAIRMVIRLPVPIPVVVASAALFVPDCPTEACNDVAKRTYHSCNASVNQLLSIVVNGHIRQSTSAQRCRSSKRPKWRRVMIDKPARAYPTKAFFVNMITRDITLADSILDLIDNSVDGAAKCEGSPPVNLDDKTDLSRYHISLTTLQDSFSIVDNCGGMTLDDAADYAFTFGRRSDEPHANYSIGVYGIGMKRAAFKLGRHIQVKSTFLDNDEQRFSFSVPIDVDEWMRTDDPPWDFDIDVAEHMDENGVEIVVQRLTREARISFANPEFLENLRRTIARDYSLYLELGLTIILNHRPINGIPIKLRKSDDFVPMRQQYEVTLDDLNGAADESVSVEIIAGMAAPPPESTEPDERVDAEKTYGWYVACNGRIVLAADRTAVSGWGTPDWPQWHYQYTGFLGIVLFTATNAAWLPLTTTKRSVDLSSDIFLRARVHMREVSKRWISYTNERKRDLVAAKQIEQRAVEVTLGNVERQQTVQLPMIPKQKVERRANVNYSVPVSRMKRLAREFGSIQLSYRDVGLSSFDYAYDELVEDE